MERMDANPDPRTRTDYMRSRLRLHIDARLGADRTLHQRFSARLEEIVRQMGDDFEQAAAALAALRTDVLAAEDGDYVDAGDDRVHDLDRWTEQPVYGLLREAFEETGTPEGLDIVQGALDLTAEIARLVGSQDFVVLVDTQIRVRRELRVYLEKDLHMDWAWGGPLAGHLVNLPASGTPTSCATGAGPNDRKDCPHPERSARW